MPECLVPYLPHSTSTTSRILWAFAVAANVEISLGSICHLGWFNARLLSTIGSWDSGCAGVRSYAYKRLFSLLVTAFFKAPHAGTWTLPSLLAGAFPAPSLYKRTAPLPHILRTPQDPAVPCGSAGDLAIPSSWIRAPHQPQ